MPQTLQTQRWKLSRNERAEGAGEADRLHAETMLGNDPQAKKQENRRRTADIYEACVKLYLTWLRRAA